MTESDTDSEEFPFDYRTTNDRFQEKLREAQESAVNRQIEGDLEQNQNNNDPLEVQSRVLRLQVNAAEKQVQKLRQQLEARKKRREHEAAIMKLTPEERADAMEVDHENIDNDITDMKAIFDYLLHIGSAPLPKNAADLSGSSFVQPHAEIREQAINNPEMDLQAKFGQMVILKANNTIVNAADDSAIRRCELSGNAYDQEFSVTFEVLESKLSIQKLDFTTSIDLDVDAGPLLHSIREERNLLAFFRLLRHYAKLEHERKTTFEKLLAVYANRSVSVEQVELDQLKFTSTNENNPLVLVLQWRNYLQEIDRPGVPVNICDVLKPDVQMKGSGNLI
ncbi:hypothetical protein BDB00DRAFT_811529 [Zychaea mexicana]|uniref:uncharacterized protein n=1 Tax=Zychaea mexicana TaxID=64656 RepID=UPI0022FEBB5B|nr:uncharacterized protein BDB00DRAFT_811529 [Zychaea mexicana]KAI9496058.1 hypothetical protein BDB00DRAFT_811529 [Zychaea mexicana]